MSETPAARPAPSRTLVALSSALAIVFGAGVATQSRINGELGRQLDNGFLAALVSFGSGFLILVVAMALSPVGRRGFGLVTTALKGRTIPWWYVAGGVAGAFLVLSQGVAASVVGIAVFTVAIVSGQTLSGLLIDRAGMGTMVAKRVTPTRLIGSLLVLVGVGVAASGQLDAHFPVWLLVMPFLAGIGIGWQQAVNGQVREVAHSPLTATFINFAVGTTVLLVITLIHSVSAGWPDAMPTSWWLYLGGPIGVVFIAGAAVLVRITGVLLLGLSMIAGQLLASVVIDLVVPVAGQVISATTLGSAAITLVAVAIAALPSRKTI